MIGEMMWILPTTGIAFFGGFQLVMGVPKSWMVYFMENPNLQMDDDRGYPYDLGNLHLAVGTPTCCW